MTMSIPRRLMRRPAEARLDGVCAGLAVYFEIDVTLVRVVWVVLSIWPGAIVLGIVAYVASWILMPVSDNPASVPTSRPILRSRTDRRVAGVCGGLAEFMGVDSTIVRVAWVVFTIIPCAIVFGVIAYVVAWLIVPSEPVAALHASPLTS